MFSIVSQLCLSIFSSLSDDYVTLFHYFWPLLWGLLWFHRKSDLRNQSCYKIKCMNLPLITFYGIAMKLTARWDEGSRRRLRFSLRLLWLWWGLLQTKQCSSEPIPMQLPGPAAHNSLAKSWNLHRVNRKDCVTAVHKKWLDIIQVWKSNLEEGNEWIILFIHVIQRRLNNNITFIMFIIIKAV